MQSAIFLRGISVVELGELSGVNTTTIYAYIHNKNMPQPYNLNRLATVLEVSAYWLMNGDDNNE